jgi:assimilatory nitrate reductase catalytic subunit
MRNNDTVSAMPHVLLPAAAWGEKDGTVTNSERRISRQRAFLPMPEDAKPDWWIVAQVARQLGYGDAFSYRNAADIFREHAALSAFENDGARVFDLGELSNVTEVDYDALQPVQWPVRAGQRVGIDRLFADGQFSTPDRKARFIAPERPALREDTSAAFPLRLNTGRLRDQWHTMTRSGQSPRLGSHKPEPFAEIHPLDAKVYGLSNDGFVRVRSRHGSCLL